MWSFVSQYLAIWEVIRTKYCPEQNRLLPYWGETAQVYSEQVISRGQSHVTGAPLSNVVMFVMLITDIRVSSLWLSIMAGCCKLQVTCNGYAPLCTVIRPLFSSLSEYPGLVSSVQHSVCLTLLFLKLSLTPKIVLANHTAKRWPMRGQK